MTRVCVFCGDDSTVLTKEHIYADWISQFFAKQYKQRLTGRVELVAEKGKMLDFPMRPFQHKARIVCHNCNHGWMSDLESGAMDHLKKMMLGDPTFLDGDAQRRLAAWCAKTALVIDRLQPDSRVVPDSYYAEMFQQKSMLKSQVVLAAFRSLTGDGSDALLGGAIKEPVSHFQAPAEWTAQDTEAMQRQFAEGRKAYKITFMVGNFVALVFGHDLPALLQIHSPKSVAKYIWPVSPGFYWEAKLSIDKIGGVPAFHAAFAPGANGPDPLPPALLRGYQQVTQ